MTDPIVDYLARIGSANMTKHDSAEIPASTIRGSLSGILKQEGFIRDYEVTGDNKQGMVKIFSKHSPNGERAISGLKRTSKLGLRNYVGTEDLPEISNGLGIAIVSAFASAIIDKEAREKNVGGEVLAYIW